MNRSRRFVLAAAGIALGLTACGNPNTATSSTGASVADQPPIIKLASGAPLGAATGAAPAAASTGVADSKIAFLAPTEFTYDGQLPALDSPAGSWFFAPGVKPDLDRVAALAASLGAVGDVRTLPDEQGGGWAVGPEDYSAAVLTVSTDGMLSWYLSAPSTATASAGCAVAISAVAPATGVSTGAAGGAVDAVSSTTASVSDVTTTEVAPLPPDVVSPDCPAPQPPVGVPTKDEALAKAKQLIAAWGYDVNSYQFDDPYADEFGASVNASLVLDGMKAPVMLSVGFGENGAVTYASGSLAAPQPGADYPTVGAAAGLERLKKQQNQFVVPLAADGVATKAVTNDAATSGIAVAPAVAPCEPEAGAVDCAPVPTEPIKVTLNSVKPDLTMVYAADNTIWLLPAYTFGSADGAQYTVIAVDDAFIQQPDPSIATTEPVADPGIAPIPATAPAAEPAPATAGAANPGTVPAAVQPTTTVPAP